MSEITEQNHYFLKFDDGNSAIVLARTSAEALILFYLEFAVEFPEEKQPNPTSVVLLEFGLKRCHILP